MLRGPDTIYATRLARAGDVALLVEVSDTTYAKDSGPKLRRYASYRIPVYWIVDLNRRIVEVRTGPFGKGKQAGYALCHIYREGDEIPVELDGQEVGSGRGVRSHAVNQAMRRWVEARARLGAIGADFPGDLLGFRGVAGVAMIAAPRSAERME